MHSINKHIILLFFCCISLIGNAQKILNGSFEKFNPIYGLAACGRGFLTHDFDSLAFGKNYDIIVSGIDALESNFQLLTPNGGGLKDCGFIDTLFPYPQGSICMRFTHANHNPPFPVFSPSIQIPMMSLKTSSTLVPNHKYLLIYYDQTPNYNSFTIYDSILVGTSITGYTTNDTLIVSTPVRGKWNRHSILFSAKYASNYITVRTYSGLQLTGGVSTVDNFQLYHLDTVYKINAGVCLYDSVKLNATIKGKRYEWSKNGVAYVPTFIDSIYYHYGTAPATKIAEFANLNGDSTDFIYVKDTGWYWNITYLSDSTISIDSFYVNGNGIMHASKTDTLICKGKNLNIGQTIPYINAMYLWNTGDTILQISVIDTGWYWQKVTINANCSKTDSFYIHWQLPSNLNLTHDTGFCAGTSITLNANNLQYNTYLWNTGATTPQIKVANAGKYIVTASNGTCTIKDSTTLSIFSLPHLSLPKDTIVCLSQLGAVILNAGKFKTYYWYPTGEHTQIIAAVNPEIYIVVVTDSNNCIGSDTTLIDDNCPYQLYMPNAFTPTNDLLNETFKGYGMGIAQFELHIYNRWGEELFSTTDINKGWDGTFKNNPCTADVYIWQVTYRLKNETSLRTDKGTVTLLK